MEKLEEDTYSKLIESLTSVKSVNKTDAMTLLSSYGVSSCKVSGDIIDS